MLSYIVQIELVRNSDFNDIDEGRKQRGKNVKISRIVFNLKLHEISVSHKFNNY